MRICLYYKSAFVALKKAFHHLLIVVHSPLEPPNAYPLKLPD